MPPNETLPVPVHVLMIDWCHCMFSCHCSNWWTHCTVLLTSLDEVLLLWHRTKREEVKQNVAASVPKHMTALLLLTVLMVSITSTCLHWILNEPTWAELPRAPFLISKRFTNHWMMFSDHLQREHNPKGCCCRVFLSLIHLLRSKHAKFLQKVHFRKVRQHGLHHVASEQTCFPVCWSFIINWALGNLFTAMSGTGCCFSGGTDVWTTEGTQSEISSCHFLLQDSQQTVNKLSCIDVIFFSGSIVCAGYHRKTWIQAVCAWCTHPSLSHSVSQIQTHPDPTLLSSLVAWHKGDPSFPTHHLNREKIKKTQRAVVLFNGEKTHSVTAAILCEITVGTHGPSCLCILLASHHWWFVCLHNERSSVGGVGTYCVCTASCAALKILLSASETMIF